MNLGEKMIRSNHETGNESLALQISLHANLIAKSR